MANTTDTDLTKIIVNKLTTVQYAAEVSAGTLSPNEFYVLTDYTPDDIDTSNYYTKTEIDNTFVSITDYTSGLYTRQPLLVSGTNIKTINGQSLLGSGDLTISGSSDIDLSDYYTKSEVDAKIPDMSSYVLSTTYTTGLSSKQDTLISGTTLKTINGESLLGSGDITITSSGFVDLSNYYTKSEINTSLSSKQDTLVSGTSIKTINGISILGSGNIAIDIPDIDLSNYYTKTQMDSQLSSYLKTTGGNLTGNIILYNNKHIFVTAEDIDNDRDGFFDETIIYPGIIEMTNACAAIKAIDERHNNNYATLYLDVENDEGDFDGASFYPITYDGKANTEKYECDLGSYNNKYWGRLYFNGALITPTRSITVSNIITKSDITDYYTKSEVDAKVSSTYKYKGSVADRASLPTTDLTVGDVYNLQDTGMNVAWTGEAWDDLGATIDLSAYALKTDIPTKISSLTNDSGYLTEHQSLKTINGTSLVGTGDITIQADMTGYATEEWVENKKYLTSHQDISGKQDVLVSGTNIKTINGASILGSGDITISSGSDTDLSNYYTKSEIDAKIPDVSSYTTESRVNELIAAYMTANYESGDTKEY